MIELVCFTVGFLLACAIFRTRRAPETPEEVRAAAAKKFYALAAYKLETPWGVEYNDDKQARMREHLAALQAARELEEK